MGCSIFVGKTEDANGDTEVEKEDDEELMLNGEQGEAILSPGDRELPDEDEDRDTLRGLRMPC